MNAPKIPQSWDECTMEELTDIHKLIQEYGENGREERNLHIWLRLAKLVVVKGEGETGDDGVRSYSLRRKGKDDGERFVCNAFDLGLYLNGVHVDGKDGDKLKQRIERKGALDWVDLAVGKEGEGGLTQLPEETISFGGRTFQLPSPLITNIVYEQYSNIQKLQQVAWQMADALKEAYDGLREKENQVAGMLSHDDKVTADVLQEANAMKDEIAKSIGEIERQSKELNEMRARVLAHMLLQRHWRWGQQEWMDNLRHHGLAVWRYEWKFDYKYTADEAERLTGWINRHAPQWLFDILTQHLQSCLGVYKTQFPELFSGDGGGGRDVIPLIAEVDTVNAIMKWQQYPGQQEVYDSNAVQVFSVLNSMTKEAKAIDEANQKMKSHRK